MSEKKDKFISEVQRVLDDSLDELNAPVLSSLNRARQQALEMKPARRRLWFWGGFPAAMATALLVLLLWPGAQPQQHRQPDFAELLMIDSGESLEFYQDDMEFYQWLSEVLDDEKGLSDYGRRLPVDGFAGACAGRAGLTAIGTGYRVDRISRRI